MTIRLAQLFKLAQQLSMTDLEYTPSIRFNFQDTNKRSDVSHILQLSSTHAKPRVNIAMTDRKRQPLPFDKEQVKQAELVSKLKTEEFFQEFDKKFIVTFDGEDKSNHQVVQSKDFKAEHHDTQDIQSSKITSFDLRPRSLLEAQISGLSLDPIKHFSEKQKNSPIPSFEVKKRTVFKSKQHLQSSNHMFKITKRKIYNKKNLEMFDQVNSCKLTEKQKQKENSLYLSLKVWKPFETDQGNPEKKSKSSIFQGDNTKQLREQMRNGLRSHTLEFWKKKLQKRDEEGTVRRQNIFRPTSLAK